MEAFMESVVPFTDLHSNKLDAAVPIDIVTEKTDAAKLSQQYPYLFPMIPDKEPLITAARKQATKEKDPTNYEIKSPYVPKDLENTTTIVQKITHETLNTQQNASDDKLILNKIFKEDSQLSENPKKNNTDIKRRGSRIKKTMKKTQIIRKKRSLNKPFLERAELFNPIAPDGEKDMIFSEEITKENLRFKRGLTEDEIIEKPYLRRNRERGKWDNKYKVWRYDSEYVDYDIPFPLYEPQPKSKQGTPGHGIELLLPQIYSIFKSMLLKTSTFNSKRNIYAHKPGRVPFQLFG